MSSAIGAVLGSDATLRRLLTPLVEAHGYAGEEERRAVDRLVASLGVVAELMPPRRTERRHDVETHAQACLLAAAIHAHERLSSDRLHALLSLGETVARLLRFVDDEMARTRGGADAGVAPDPAPADAAGDRAPTSPGAPQR
jgi:hypothetical protein